MTNEEFDRIVRERTRKIVRTLSDKAREYATGDDRLHNFNKGAAIADKPREQVLWGFALKHYISFLDILEALPETVPSNEVIDEKIGDLINYLILVEACLKERNDNTL